jgi:O-antigen/teichoic acid export membrane protein
MKKDKNIILDNFIWRFAERCGAQLVTAVVTLLLARILMPEDYGRTALVAVFINILQVFIDSGLGTALIQKKDADDLDSISILRYVWCCMPECSLRHLILRHSIKILR